MKTGRGLIAWMAGNSIAANLLMLALIIGGLFSALSIKQEVFPEFELDIINVSVSYPGTSPEEVEQGVVLAIEEEIRSHENVDRVTAVATEGRASIVAELVTGSDANKTLQDLKSAVDRITSLPDDAERPVVSLQSRRREVLRIALSGDVEERQLYDLATRVKNELTALPGITQVELRGLREPEVRVEVSQRALNSHGLTLRDIASRIRQYAIDIPAGGLKAEGGEVLLRTKERREFSHEFMDVPIVRSDTGTVLPLGELAELREGFAESDREAYFNGRRAALINVYRTGEQTPLEISEIVRGYVSELGASLPPGMEAVIYNDRSDVYKDRLRLLMRNGILGLVLVLISLGLILEPRLAFWVAMGMPISIIGSFIILKYTGGSINMVSMFAFIVTLGIIVDDAVVVGENIYHKRQSGRFTPIEASVVGVREMAAPVFVAVATNIIAFVPMLMVTGSTGRFFSVLPAVVIAVFLISFIESLYVLPAHLSYPYDKREGRALAALDRIPRKFSAYMERFVSSAYAPAVRWAINARYLVVVAAAAVLLVAFAYWNAGWIDFSFRPNIETDRVDAEIELPFGSRVEEVRRIARLVEEGGMRAVERSGGPSILTGVMTDIGRSGSNTAEVSFDLVQQGKRKVTTREFSRRWREEVGEIPGLEKLFFDFLAGPGGSSAINVDLTHSDHRTLESAATELAAAIGDFSGVTDINDGYARGKPQIDFRMSPEGRAAGLDSLALGEQLRHAFYGIEALRLQRGQDEIRVMVRLPESERTSLYDLDDMLVRTADGGNIPLARAADVTHGRAYTAINRVDGRRVISVTANVIPGQANENKIIESLKADYLPGLAAKYPGLVYSFEGRQREQRNTAGDLFAGIGLVMPAIFCMLAVIFRSYVLAFLIMLCIPFGLVSAMLGHIIMGYNLSIISVFGMIALCGIVVNGGVVYTVTANRYVSEGMEPLEATHRAAVRRFRPIVLTAVTTFFGLAPMIFEQSVQARFLIPMAISLGYGILFTTVVILVLTPSLYAIYHDRKPSPGMPRT